MDWPPKISKRGPMAVTDLCTIARTRRPLVAEEIRALDWMEKNGHPGYWERVRVLQDFFDEHVAESGPGGNHCPFVQESLDKAEADIAEEARSAIDRIDDWQSDGYN